MMTRARVSPLLLVLALFVSISLASDTNYQCLMSDFSGSVSRLWTNGTTHIGMSGREQLDSLAWDAVTNTYYAYALPKGELVSVNGASGVATTIRFFGSARNKAPHISAMAFYKGSLYAFSKRPSLLVRLQQPFATSLWERVSNVGDPSVEAVDIDVEAGLLYAVSNSARDILVIKLPEGTLQRRVAINGAKGTQFTAMSFVDRSTLLAFSRRPSPSLYTISRINGRASFFKSMPVVPSLGELPDIRGLVCYYAPPPTGRGATMPMRPGAAGPPGRDVNAAARAGAKKARSGPTQRFVHTALPDNPPYYTYQLHHGDGIFFDDDTIPTLVQAGDVSATVHLVYDAELNVLKGQGLWGLFHPETTYLDPCQANFNILTDLGSSQSSVPAEPRTQLFVLNQFEEQGALLWVSNYTESDTVVSEAVVVLEVMPLSASELGGSVECGPMVEQVYPPVVWDVGQVIYIIGWGLPRGTAATSLFEVVIGTTRVSGTGAMSCHDLTVIIPGRVLRCVAVLDEFSRDPVSFPGNYLPVSVEVFGDNSFQGNYPPNGLDTMIVFRSGCDLPCGSGRHADEDCTKCICSLPDACPDFVNGPSQNAGAFRSTVSQFLIDLARGQLSSDERFLALAETYKDTRFESMPTTRYSVGEAQVGIKLGIDDVKPLRVVPVTAELNAFSDISRLANVLLSTEANDGQWRERRVPGSEETQDALEFQ